jgi:hypothetical protein
MIEQVKKLATIFLKINFCFSLQPLNTRCAISIYSRTFDSQNAHSTSFFLFTIFDG